MVVVSHSRIRVRRGGRGWGWGRGAHCTARGGTGGFFALEHCVVSCLVGVGVGVGGVVGGDGALDRSELCCGLLFLHT